MVNSSKSVSVVVPLSISYVLYHPPFTRIVLTT